MSLEKEHAVIRFFSDGKYSTCSRRHKAIEFNSVFEIGEEVAIRWGKRIERGIVVYTDGK